MNIVKQFFRRQKDIQAVKIGLADALYLSYKLTAFCSMKGLWFSAYVTGTGRVLPFTINQEIL